MQKSQSGFTLVELVVVIVLLGILGVTALGKFQDLSSEAADASEQGIASELSSAAAINYAASVVNVATATTILNADCTSGGGAPSDDMDALMASGAAPTNNLTYAITANGDVTVEDAACIAGQVYTCSITHADGTATNAEAAIICAN